MKKIICFDIDNIICNTVKNKYRNSKPNIKVINLINLLFEKGHTIKIFTARYMGRNNDNVRKAKKQGYNLTKKQLKKWNVNYHKLIFGKQDLVFLLMIKPWVMTKLVYKNQKKILI